MGDIVSMFAGPVLGLLGANEQANATRDAADLSSQAARDQVALQRQMYQEAIARQQPFLQMGTNALNRLYALNQPGANAANFLAMDPGYNFRLGEGIKALDRSAAAKGGLFSGAAGKALTRYGQGVASEEYGNAYNRLAQLANLGPSAAGVMNNLGSGYAGNANALAMMNAANQGNAALMQGNIRATQYGTAGNLLNTALSKNWGSSGGSAPMPGGGTYDPAYDWSNQSWS